MRYLTVKHLGAFVLILAPLAIVFANGRQEYVERVTALALEDGDVIFRSALRDIQNASIQYEYIALPPEEVFERVRGEQEVAEFLIADLERQLSEIAGYYENALLRFSQILEGVVEVSPELSEGLEATMIDKRIFQSFFDLVFFLAERCNEAVNIIRSSDGDLSPEEWRRLLSIRSELFSSYSALPEASF